MNHFCKQTLFLVGKNERESALANWKIGSGYATFQSKFSAYLPFACGVSGN